MYEELWSTTTALILLSLWIHSDTLALFLILFLLLLLIAFQKGLQLPGSRFDVVRTKSLSGPSPVGGSMGGTESQSKLGLDEFELQAAHYNMACAHAQLGNLNESIAALRVAFENGFDNYATVRSDPDLDPIKSEKDFEVLMQTYEKQSKGGFNPFGFFKKD